uniref:Glutathione hydrolase n=1 Tax=Poecilia latipinna TaxID=48699 RepID=A0A3B3UWY1_9TELE
MAKKVIIVALAVLLLACLAIFLGVFFGLKSNRANGSWKAAVAADAGPCSEVGRDILLKGGSAVDASIASLLCVGLINAHSMGIGGGLFLTIYDAKTGKVEVIDARETAPHNATQDMFKNDTNLSQKGALSIAVPGELRGYDMAHKRYGKLPWKDLFQPSIELAEKGFPMGKAMAIAIDRNKELIVNDTALCEVFCAKNGSVLKENDIIKFTRLAGTYRKIAEKGAEEFYTGQLSDELVKDIQAAGGIITKEDLRDYEPVLDESPLRVNVGEYAMVVPNAPASGPVLSLILNILNGKPYYAVQKHPEWEKMCCSVSCLPAALTERRSFLLIQPEIGWNMTSTSYADVMRAKITDDTTHPMEYYEPQFWLPENHGTSHLSVVSEDGSAVAATSTINHYLGSKVMSGSTGIILNNEMDDFSSPYIINGFDVPPSPSNFIKPGKRPMSSMCPTILFDKNNNVKMVVGGSGGTKITTSIAQVILKALFFGFDVDKAVTDPRLHNQLSPNTTQAESDFDKEIIDGLAKKNHVTAFLTSPGAVVQAVLRRDNKLSAKSDPRKGGYAAGY